MCSNRLSEEETWEILLTSPAGHHVPAGRQCTARHLGDWRGGPAQTLVQKQLQLHRMHLCYHCIFCRLLQIDLPRRVLQAGAPSTAAVSQQLTARRSALLAGHGGCGQSARPLVNTALCRWLRCCLGRHGVAGWHTAKDYSGGGAASDNMLL